ncbi:MAG: short-chain dehydrogenase/reductase [Candidatus Puniceispirillum sp.]|nr:short-chain dehydrogenase/reductase [Candidatus Puniceispirillum sp.]
MKKTHEKKIVLITGTSSGFGYLTAKSLLEHGHTVIATMRDIKTRNAHVAKDLEALAIQTGSSLSLVEMDVTSDASVAIAAEDVMKKHTHVDVIVNNAGTLIMGISEAFTVDEIKEQFETNTFGPARVARAFLPSMRARRQGLLIQVTSVSGRLVFPFFGHYSASKFAAEALAETYHYELSSFGIESVIVEPGPYPSNIMSSSQGPRDEKRVSAYGELAKMPDAMKESFKELFASENAPDAQDVADAIVGLVEQEGKRPLRTVVMPKGMEFGVDALNHSTQDVQNTLLKSLQMESLI